jgi:phenylalanyl-tRNA synthetase beta chain
MRVPLEWLKQYCPIEATAEEIAVKLTMGGLEVEGNEPPDEVYLQAVKKQVPADVAGAAASLGNVLNVYVTPNRGDCLSMVGVAREVSALFGLPLRQPAPPPSSGGGEAAQQTSVTIEDSDLCPRYAARLVRGVKIGPSPKWLQARLAAAGQRSVNNVVDVTNYVMLEVGQPLHAFDLDTLKERRIVVRRARPGEKLLTLDGTELDLTSEMLVIADAERAVALAGIMGGAETEVTDATTNILIESAHFDPLSVRRTSRATGIKTEASYRFERVVDPDGVRRAVDRACQLLAEIGQPEAVDGVADSYLRRHPVLELKLEVARVDGLLGMEIPSHTAADALRALGFIVHTEGHGSTDTLAVQVPSWRSDVTQEEDLIEEIGRIYGYENIPETLPYANTTQGGDSPLGRFLMRCRNSLVGCGLQEVVTHSLTPPAVFDTYEDLERRVPIRNALSTELSGLRRSLLPTLLETVQHNLSRGIQDLAMFEIGRVWEQDLNSERPLESVSIAGLLTGAMTERGWQKEPRPLVADFSAARGVVERLIHDLAITNCQFVRIGENQGELPQFHPGRTALVTLGGEIAGVVGEAHPRLTQSLGLRDRIYFFELSCEPLQAASQTDTPRYRPLSPYPAVVRDLAPRVEATLPYGAIEDAVQSAIPEFLESYRLTDVFQGPPLPDNQKALTLSFTFRSLDRTLGEAEINEAMDALRTALQTRCAATFA